MGDDITSIPVLVPVPIISDHVIISSHISSLSILVKNKIEWISIAASSYFAL
jgi:hypothetical protein